PPRPGAYQLSFGGNTDAFVTKVNSGGASLGYSTYYGGTFAETGWAIAANVGGNAFLTGKYPTFNGTSSDVLFAEFSTSGSSLVYSTNFGGSSTDEGRGIAVGIDGLVTIVGKTNSTNFPIANALYSANSGA